MAPTVSRLRGGMAGVGVAGMLLGSSVVSATDIPIVGLKLIVVDKTVAASKAKAVFVAKDAAITKGAGDDPTEIAATLDVAYDAVHGTFDMPQGANWLVNSESVGKYVNKTAPTGGAVKVSVIKPALLVKVVGKSLGDTPIDISSAPSGAVYVADTIVNDGQTTQLCTQFSGCVHKTIAGDTGFKLICKGNSTGDAGCTAVPPIMTSTTLATTTTTLGTSCVNGIQDGAETDVDCGGGTCGPCVNGQICLAASDCVSGVCSGGICGPVALNETDQPAEADFCNIQFPASFSVSGAQSSPLIYGQIFEAGVTEATGAAPGIQAEVGFGPNGSDPRTNFTWSYVSAVFNVQVGNDDEYQGSFTAPGLAATYSYVYRFTNDGGMSYTYCDLDGAGSDPGLTFSAANLGTMTVTPP